jgi:peptidoglycan biosynthesis protein MviN/MurJ (putative lipid II flippase)
MFYGAVIGAILHCLNMVSGLFRGAIVAEASATASSIKADSYSLASPTSVRRILAAGAGMDTEVVPVGESDDAGSATKL